MKNGQMNYWLVVWNFLFFPIVGMMIQSDELIFNICQGGRYTTNQIINDQ